MRLIDAYALIPKLASVARLARSDQQKALCGRMLFVVQNAPTVEPKWEWVSVKDRLPEERYNPNTNDFECVLCATEFGDVRAYKFGAIEGDKQEHFWHGFGVMDKYVTHWMPLPEPPKEVETDD